MRTRRDRRVRFSVLGPLKVVEAGNIVSVPAAKQRIVLATLLLRANRYVSIDELIERAWDPDEPAPGRGAVQTHISRLRRTLERGGIPQFIHTHESGYIAEVATDELDILQHRGLVGLACAEAEAGQAAVEADLLASALTLWRQAPLANVPSHSLHAVDVPMLVEEHLRTIERWGELALRLGRHDELIVRMKSAMVDHPLRERLCAQLMLALYRSGRQAEALEAYQAIVSLLREELGVAPGPELRETHVQVLRQENAGSADRPAGAGGSARVRPLSTEIAALVRVLAEQAPPRPVELPAEPPVLLGRSAELERVRSLLSAERRGGVVAINGAGGVGKSALAISVAHRAAHRFPDGSLYVDLRGSTLDASPLTPGQALGRMLRSLGMRSSAVPADVEEAAGRMRSLTSGRRLLIVLDNAQDATQVRLLLPGGDTSRVIVTSRRTLASLEGAVHEQLAPLRPDDAVAVLSALIGRRLVGEQPLALVRIAESCGGLPLALHLAARRLLSRPHWTAGTLADHLADARHLLSMLSEDDDGGMRASLSVSYHRLASEPGGAVAARMLRLLGLTDLAFVSPSQAARLTGLTAKDAEKALAQLAEARLAEPGSADSYLLSGLVRRYARERAEQEPVNGARPAGYDISTVEGMRTTPMSLCRPGEP